MRLLPAWLHFARSQPDSADATATPRAIAPLAASRPRDLFEAAQGGAEPLKRAAQAVQVDKLPKGVAKAAGLRVLASGVDAGAGAGAALLVYTKPPIGQGSTYKVYRGIDLRSGEPVAVRATSSPDSCVWPELAAELEAAPLCKNGLEALELARRDRRGKASRTYVVQPLLRGDMVSAVNRVRTEADWVALGNALALHVAHAIAPSLEALHEARWAHRDVKPDNILLDRAGVPHLADLGAARPARAGAQVAPFGTLEYMAPEVLYDRRTDLLAADVHSFGATLWALVVGSDYPVTARGRDIREVMQGLAETHAELQTWRQGRRRALGRLSSPTVRSLRHVAEPLRSLILDMTEQDPQLRPTLPEVCERLRGPGFALSDSAKKRLMAVLLATEKGAGEPDMAVQYAHRAWRRAHGDEAADILLARLQEAL